MHRLILGLGQANEKEFHLVAGSSTIGRSHDNEICVRHKSLSRRHARLEVDEDGVVLVDLGSKNGTQIDGIAVEERRLRGGESFQCGSLLFTFLNGDHSASLSTGTPPVADGVLDVTHLSMKELVDVGGPVAPTLDLRVKKNLRQAVAKMRILLKVAQLLSSPRSLDQLLGQILELAQEVLDIDRSAILLIDEATGELRERVARVRPGLPRGERIYSEHIVRHVVEAATATLYSGPATESRFSEAASIAEQSICASMCAPLRPRENVIGALYVDNVTNPDRFNADDLEFLGAFANQAALAIDNAFLYQRLERQAVRRNNLLRFFPPAAIDRLLEERQAVLGVQEAEVTILFADITGFARLSSKAPPRRIVEMLGNYFSVMAEIVFRHRGTLEKHIGNALMAIWGVPYRQEDDAENAVRAAVEMQRALGDLNRRHGDGPELEIHIGLNTGEVAAGNIGSEQFLQYATIGGPTNVASWACSAATAREILLTESTRRGLGDSWPLEKLPPVKVEEQEEPLELYRLGWGFRLSRGQGD